MTTPSDDAHDKDAPAPSTPVSAGEDRDTVEAGGATVPGEGLPAGHAQTQPIEPDGSPAPVDPESHLTADTEGKDVDALHGKHPSDVGAAPPRAGQRPTE
jgi:hypothetical protein